MGNVLGGNARQAEREQARCEFAQARSQAREAIDRAREGFQELLPKLRPSYDAVNERLELAKFAKDWELSALLQEAKQMIKSIMEEIDVIIKGFAELDNDSVWMGEVSDESLLECTKTLISIQGRAQQGLTELALYEETFFVTLNTVMQKSQNLLDFKDAYEEDQRTRRKEFEETLHFAAAGREREELNKQQLYQYFSDQPMVTKEIIDGALFEFCDHSLEETKEEILKALKFAPHFPYFDRHYFGIGDPEQRLLLVDGSHELDLFRDSVEHPERLRNVCGLTICDEAFFADLPAFAFLQDRITEVDLSWIGDIPPEIARFSHLQRITCSNSAIFSLPEELAQLAFLEELDVQYNRFQSIPEVVFTFDRLRKLDFSQMLDADEEDGLCHLPSDIGNLSELRSLKLGMNHIRILPRELGKCEKLETLCCEHNELVEVPAELIGLGHLETLDLSENDLTRLPRDLSGLRSLRHLHLRKNYISELPASIGSLVHLRELDCQSNFTIERLPAEIGRLTNLVHLNVADNKLRGLPKSIGLLKQLEVLSCHRNEIRLLPDELAELVSLKILTIYKNGLRRVPRRLFELPRLGLVLLEGNRLGDKFLENMHPGLCKTSSLTCLGLHDNAFTEDGVRKHLLSALRDHNSTVTDLGINELSRATLAMEMGDYYDFGERPDEDPLFRAKADLNVLLSENRMAGAEAIQRARCLLFCAMKLLSDGGDGANASLPHASANLGNLPRELLQPVFYDVSQFSVARRFVSSSNAITNTPQLRAGSKKRGASALSSVAGDEAPVSPQSRRARR